MAWLLFLLVNLFFGWTVTKALRVELRFSESLALTGFFAVFCGSWMALLMVWLVGYRFGIILSALIQVAAIFFFHIKPPGRQILITRPAATPQKKLQLYGTVLFGALAVYLTFLSWKLNLAPYHGSLISGSWTALDLPLHLSFISNFSQQNFFTFKNPIFAPGGLTYPFIMDFYSGILLRLGAGLHWSLFIPVEILILAFFRLLITTSELLTKNKPAAYMHGLLIAGSGAVFGLFYFFQDVLGKGQNFTDYAIIRSEGLYFSNIVNTHLFPQRSILLGFCAFLVIILLIYCSEASAEKTGRKLYFAAACVMFGLLPFTHVHTFLFTGAMLGCLLIYFYAQGRLSGDILACFIMGLLLATPQLAWQFANNWSSHFGYWHFGWFAPVPASVVVFWLKNWGLLPVFVVLGSLPLRRYFSGSLAWSIYWTSLIIFVAANLYSFQPQLYDNMKLLVYCYWGFSLIMAAALSRFCSTQARALLVFGLLSLSSGAGMLALLRDGVSSSVVFTAADIQEGRQLQKEIPAGSLVLTIPEKNNLVSTYAGRQILVGSPEWLASYGINSGQVTANAGQIFSGSSNSRQLLKNYKINFVAFSRQEVRPFGINLGFFQSRFNDVATDGSWYVFRVN